MHKKLIRNTRKITKMYKISQNVLLWATVWTVAGLVAAVSAIAIVAVAILVVVMV